MIRRSRGARPIVCCLAATAALSAVSCGAALTKLPTGPGSPAPDAAAAFAEATKSCRAVASMTADASVSGSAGGRRLRARLSLGIQDPASARLEAIGPFARPLFMLVARGETATLLLNDDNRILEAGRPDAVLEAITGVPLDAAGLRDALTGCSSSTPSDGQQVGDQWRMMRDGSRSIYLNRNPQSAPWRLAAVVHQGGTTPEWRAEYANFVDGLPRTIRFVSRAPDRFNLRLELRDIELNPALGPDAFQIRVPASATPITLEEVRRAGPLRDEPR
jgi:outer membrane lipoprotein-sorting protein